MIIRENEIGESIKYWIKPNVKTESRKDRLKHFESVYNKSN